jgi:hypothetical protein
MDCVEGDCSSTTPETSDVSDSSTLHVPVRSSEYGRGSIVYGMSSLSVRPTVTFSANVTVHKFIDRAPDARKGPWMQLAVDRHRFQRRIRQTELALGTIFTVEHRNKMLYYINNKI